MSPVLSVRIVFCADCGGPLEDRPWPPKRCDACKAAVRRAKREAWLADPATREWDRVYRMMRARLQRGSMSRADFDAWLLEHGRAKGRVRGG